ncbi:MULTISPECIES: low temperature requirement protein A [Serratia]|uniref:Low temperature requirement protein A n=1 Tax=Serratia marcescens TaxID=615 RepID=A0ABX5NDI7_SERMA|nr:MULTISPECIES: low temperature requirement protein A [Serratia]AVU34012.1 low temperature requirement protein A [Serratia marcescens]AVU39117.1 low temperature requirement protein A [Serratia marcescens]EHT9933659.1 low temperature requirement protein A [Serratia marcescens]EIJ6672793.1 low temperature requirement protein A [Serratia marcescens]EIJ7463339.1 low temperature requirement protein A [Serratia marcescens]
MSQNLLRVRDGQGASVSFSELLFDLIYVFAVTQLSHYLLHHLTLTGALETLLLWFAVWLAWQYTAWVTNWFNPDTRQIRLLLFAIMLLGLFAAAALPQAFGERGLIFALFYVAIQVGRSVTVLRLLVPGHPLKRNFHRILGWLCISAVFWIAGGLAEGNARLALWAVAVLCEYVSPMFGFRLPVLGRSDSSSEWSIEGHHLAERCQLFVIVALGETILITGATLSEMESWNLPVLIASLVAFLGSLAMWWIYFDTSSKAGSHAISQAENPGQLGAYFHYVHVALVGAIIVCAVANELVIAHPDGRIQNATAAVLLLGPALYLFANALYKRLVYHRFPLSHLVGLLALAVLAPVAYLTDLLMVNGLTTLIMVVVAVWESISRGRAPRRHAEA